MNLYFLVEGASTERKLYPAWLNHLIPSLTRVYIPADAQVNNYYLVSGGGQPQLLDIRLSNSVDDIVETGRFDYFVIVLDAEDVSVQERKKEVEDRVDVFRDKLALCKVQIIIQNKCIESWALGNRHIFSRNPPTRDLAQHIQFFNVFHNDPELMEKPDAYDSSVASYHYDYLRALLNAKNIRYTKKYPRDVKKPYYLDYLCERVQNFPLHLQSFQLFLNFCNLLNQQIESDF